MCKGMEGIDSISKFTQAEIERLWSEQRSNVVVKELENEIQMGIYYGVGFVVTNENKNSESDFSYVVNVKGVGNCEISEQEAESYIISGRSSTMNIPRGKDYVDIIKFNIPII